MYHITAEGPKRCSAKPGNCPLGGEHFGFKEDAESSYLESLVQNNETFPPKKDELDLPCAFGTMRVKNGDLTDVKSRTALISGLCGSLALAVHDKTGGTPHFVCYGVKEDEDLEQLFAEDGNVLLDVATHALVESKTKPGTYLDSYGQKTLADLQNFYGDDIRVIPGNRAMLVAYSETGVPDILGKFADSVIDLDSKGKSYDYDDFDLDDQDFEDDE